MLRLIAFILIFALFLVFIVFNLDNKCDVSLGFMSFTQLPVFLTAFSSFVLGMLFSLFFVVSSRRRWRKMARTEPAPGITEKPKKSREKKNKSPNDSNSLNGAAAQTDEIKKETGTYGID